MTITLKTLVPGHFLHTTISTHYTVPNNVKAVINNGTVANNNPVSTFTFEVHLVDTGASSSSTTIIIPTRPIAPLESYGCPELVGKSLTSTGTIRALANSTSTLALNISGWEVT